MFPPRLTASHCLEKWASGMLSCALGSLQLQAFCSAPEMHIFLRVEYECRYGFLFQNATNGSIHYLNESLSVYRYSSTGSLSEQSTTSRKTLYEKKLRFLDYIDRSSGHKYLIATSIARARVALGLTLFLTRHWVQQWLR